ncbi:hypothetical protein SESBI_07926 [Sesbania bispinosa]|nr:hypothetical protein SESBI_07926 [Sesbania bispinosa]
MGHQQMQTDARFLESKNISCSWPSEAPEWWRPSEKCDSLVMRTTVVVYDRITQLKLQMIISIMRTKIAKPDGPHQNFDVVVNKANTDIDSKVPSLACSNSTGVRYIISADFKLTFLDVRERSVSGITTMDAARAATAPYFIPFFSASGFLSIPPKSNLSHLGSLKFCLADAVIQSGLVLVTMLVNVPELLLNVMALDCHNECLE